MIPFLIEILQTQTTAVPKSFFTTEVITFISGFVFMILAIIFNPNIIVKINEVKLLISKTEQRIKNQFTDLFDEFKKTNDETHELLKNRLDTVDESIANLVDSLDEHTKFIEKYTAEKETISSLELVIRDVLRYIDNESPLFSYISYVGRVYINTVQEVLDIGIEEIEKDVLENKLRLARSAIFSPRKHSYIDCNFIKELKNRRLKNKLGETLIEKMLDLRVDTVNSKSERFRNISESFLQNLTRDIVLLWNEYDAKPNIQQQAG